MSEFTVAICTYRRVDVLPDTMASLAAVDQPDADWDLLVVDNACDPRVERITREFVDRLPVRYTSESQVGIARARNHAVGSTEAPVIIFADDDVLFDRKWLRAMIGSVRRHDECDFWGGRIEPLWQIDRPAWFDVRRCPMLGDSIVRYDLGDTPRAWRSDEDPEFYTCNLALRTDAVREAGMFDVSLGHQGCGRGGGEDSWMIRSIRQAGGSGWYAADALLRHPVPASRLTRRHARAFAWRQGRVGVDMLRREHADDLCPAGRTPRWLYRVAVEQMLAGLSSWTTGTVCRDAGLAFAGQFNALFNFSKLYHAFRR